MLQAGRWSNESACTEAGVSRNRCIRISSFIVSLRNITAIKSRRLETKKKCIKNFVGKPEETVWHTRVDKVRPSRYTPWRRLGGQEV
jgi:hypothetical protein